MQKLVFFIESNGKNYGLASNIANLYMNRFIIDEESDVEDAGHEIVKIYEVNEFRPRYDYAPTDEKTNGKLMGMGHIIIF